tara:strand:- start:114 stop:476 length:363 start_codon:yes stop_codon:yes gene_type:complete
MTEESNVEMQTDSTENNESNVSADSHVGQVQWFDKKKGYGFIKIISEDQNNIQVFFHFSDIKSKNYKVLFPGEFVSMDLGEKDGKQVCKNITGVYGLPLLTDNEEYHYRVMPKRDNRVSQ